ncbi:MAG TPA: hypothetical protein VFP87_15210, partial [Chitinophagaceae bacterium]|nr:hypothetical protein [Chitinophagaceae bacterium]
MLVIFILILAAVIFIETPGGQNWIARQFTKKFSRELKTKIDFKRVSFSLLNKLNLEGFLMEDQFHDTLVYAGNLQLRITDWFIFKSKAEIKYVQLDNAVIHFNRVDTLWNYQFLVNYFTPTSAAPKKNAGIEFNLKKLRLHNVIFTQKDPGKGQDLVAAVGSMDLNANDISVSNNNVDIPSLVMTEPLFALYTYPAKGTSGQKKDTAVVQPRTAADSLLQWNQAGWRLNIGSLKISNGSFKSIRQTNESASKYFDPDDIEFKSINGQFNNVTLNKDTFSAKVNLSTKERSGFIVRSLKSDVKMNPTGMYFDHLYVRTNNSTI